MRLIVQNYGTGELQAVDAPDPSAKGGMLLVRNATSVVSVGTEKAMIDVAKKSLIGKALARPDWVRQVVDKVRTEGLMEAWRQSKARLDFPVPLGYSSAGVVEACGSGVSEHGFRKGDRVACTGSGFAAHADLILVPPNMCAGIPDNVGFEAASYGALGGISMEAIRLARVEFGHRVGLIGLGLLGQIAVQILVAAGCHVLAMDISEEKCALARSFGAEAAVNVAESDPIQAAVKFSEGEGLDSVVILAAAKSNEPLEQAAEMCRERGVVVAAGLIGLEIPRKHFFEKELELRISKAWGPGVFDPDYEQRGVMWPLAYARWTAQRNLAEFLAMLSVGRVDVESLTTHRFPFAEALKAYEMILKGGSPAIGVILEYEAKGYFPDIPDRPEPKAEVREETPLPETRLQPKNKVGLGLIGAGLFARGTFLPILKSAAGLDLKGIATAGGVSGQHIAENFGFDYATSDYHDLLSDDGVDLVMILTRHNSHARFVIEALKAGKHVFVEKPLCLTIEELNDIRAVVRETGAGLPGRPILMVGFNRRFAPAAVKAREFLKGYESSAVIHIRVNAGFVPANSWVHHPEEGGGRIIGEVCHFIDLAQYFTGARPKLVHAACAEGIKGLRDNICASIQMDNGAAVALTYTAAGDKSFPREEAQIFAGGGVFVLDNFKTTAHYSGGKKRTWRTLETDRGHKAEIIETVAAARKAGASPIDFKSLAATTRATFALEESIAAGRAVAVDLD